MTASPLRLSLAFAVAVLLPPAADGRAQELVYPIGVQVGGGLVEPFGAAHGLGIGWDVSVAGDIELRPGFALRIDYVYGRFGAEELDLVANAARATLRSKTQMHLGTIDLVWKHALADRAAVFYLMGGPLVSRRRVVLTDSGSTGAFDEVVVDVCRPQWFQCGASPLPYNLVLGVRKSTDLGGNVGLGVEWDVGLGARLFAEARAVFIDGPTFRDAGGSSRSADAFFVPLVAGLRFDWR